MRNPDYVIKVHFRDVRPWYDKPKYLQETVIFHPDLSPESEEIGPSGFSGPELVPGMSLVKMPSEAPMMTTPVPVMSAGFSPPVYLGFSGSTSSNQALNMSGQTLPDMFGQGLPVTPVVSCSTPVGAPPSLVGSVSPIVNSGGLVGSQVDLVPPASVGSVSSDFMRWLLGSGSSDFSGFRPRQLVVSESGLSSDTYLTSATPSGPQSFIQG